MSWSEIMMFCAGVVREEERKRQEKKGRIHVEYHYI